MDCYFLLGTLLVFCVNGNLIVLSFVPAVIMQKKEKRLGQVCMHNLLDVSGFWNCEHLCYNIVQCNLSDVSCFV